MVRLLVSCDPTSSGSRVLFVTDIVGTIRSYELGSMAITSSTNY
jgi:hypothetical protein